MSFDDQMKNKIQENPDVLPVTEIPDEILCRVKDYKFKVDKQGDEALFLTLLTDNNLRIIQKYMPSGYDTLNKSVNACGGFDQLKVQWRIWRKSTVGQMKLPRLLPTKKTAYEVADKKKKD